MPSQLSFFWHDVVESTWCLPLPASIKASRQPHWLGWLVFLAAVGFVSLWVSGNLASIQTKLMLGPSPTTVCMISLCLCDARWSWNVKGASSGMPGRNRHHTRPAEQKAFSLHPLIFCQSLQHTMITIRSLILLNFLTRLCIFTHPPT